MNDWKNIDNHLVKVFRFDNYLNSVEFVKAIAVIAERQLHHPQMVIDYLQITIRMTTHDQGNVITNKDYTLSKRIDMIYNKCRR